MEFHVFLIQTKLLSSQKQKYAKKAAENANESRLCHLLVIYDQTDDSCPERTSIENYVVKAQRKDLNCSDHGSEGAKTNYYSS
jgi:hypothetical protein